MYLGNILKRLAFVVLLLFVFTPAPAQVDKISWRKGVKLTWDDFQGTPNTSSPYIAYTSNWINYTYNWDGNKKLSFNVTCSFQRSKSWKNSSHNLTEDILQHEQGHFDIGEIYTRKMRQAFTNYCASHTYNTNTQSDLDGIFHKLLDETHVIEDRYDNETNHSILTAKQTEWYAKITSMLEELSAYAEKQ